MKKKADGWWIIVSGVLVILVILIYLFMFVYLKNKGMTITDFLNQIL